MCSVMSADDSCRDCRSVLIARNSTPAICGLDHAVDGVGAATADADDADDGLPDRPGLAERRLALIAVAAGEDVVDLVLGPDVAARSRPPAGVEGSSRFSGSSEEKAERRRSCGDGM